MTDFKCCLTSSTLGFNDTNFTFAFCDCLVAPTAVNITGHERAKAGETIKLKCTTDMSNPKAQISWFALGQPVSGANTKFKPSPLVSRVKEHLYISRQIHYLCPQLNG